MKNQNPIIKLFCEFSQDGQQIGKQVLNVSILMTVDEFLKNQKDIRKEMYISNNKRSKNQSASALVFKNTKYDEHNKNSLKHIGIVDGSQVQILYISEQQNNNIYNMKSQKEQQKIVNQDDGLVSTTRQILSKPQLNSQDNLYKIEEEIQMDFKQLKDQQIYSPYQHIPILVDLQNPELLFHIIDDQLRQSNYKIYWSLESESKNIYSLQSSFFRGLESSTCICISIQEIDTLNYTELMENKEMYSYFVQMIKSIVMNHQHAEDVIIHSIEQGPIRINIKILNPKLKIIQVDKIVNDIIKIYPNSNPQIELYEYFKEIKLSVKDFNPKYNIQWPENHIEYDYRGPQKQKYFYPRGWYGFALNLKNHNIYDDGNDDWLSMDQNPNQWKVMYHGTKVPSFQRVLKNEIIQLREQKYKDTMALNKQQLVGDGIYLTNHIEVCEQFCNSTFIGDVEFKMAFQSRAYPNGLLQIHKMSDINSKVGNKDWDNDYFVVKHPSHLRPYRILIKMIDHKKQAQPYMIQNNKNKQEKQDCTIQ